MSSRDDVAVAEREASSARHTTASRAVGTPPYPTLAHIFAENDDDEDSPAVGTPTDVAPFSCIDVRLSHAADERAFNPKESMLAVSLAPIQSTKNVAVRPSCSL